MEDKSYYNLKGYINSSSLKYIKADPARFKMYIDGEIAEDEKSYLSTGKLVHLRVLELEVFKKNVESMEYIIPRSAQQKGFIEDFINFKNKYKVSEALMRAYRANYSTKEKDETVLKKAEELRDQFKPYEKYLKVSKTKEVIKQQDYDKILTIERNVKAHKLANKLLYGYDTVIDDDIVAFNEFQILWEYEGIKCKSLLDRVIVDKKNKVITLVDLKTTSDLNNFRSSYDKYRYDRQLAFYLAAITRNHKDLIGDDNIEEYSMNSYIVAVDTIDHRVKVFDIKEEELTAAAKEIADLLATANWHIKENKWSHTKVYYEGEGSEEL